MRHMNVERYSKGKSLTIKPKKTEILHATRPHQQSVESGINAGEPAPLTPVDFIPGPLRNMPRRISS